MGKPGIQLNVATRRGCPENVCVVYLLDWWWLLLGCLAICVGRRAGADGGLCVAAGAASAEETKASSSRTHTSSTLSTRCWSSWPIMHPWSHIPLPGASSSRHWPLSSLRQLGWDIQQLWEIIYCKKPCIFGRTKTCQMRP